ncbi:mRNA-processing endoribonuclease [Maudiozyma humilis]|uniref:Transcriptional protein SWT1 n=1 Tax=Maudiozyma humilis TaxID=51915 RepID=A0AAV5RWT9_MAUHU|nr:mRNA-processing endoribonuclease [Kazachstania humilis]
MPLESRYNDNNLPPNEDGSSTVRKRSSSTSRKYTLDQLNNMLNINDPKETQEQPKPAKPKHKKKAKKRKNKACDKENDISTKPVIDEPSAEPLPPPLATFNTTPNPPVGDENDEDIDMLLETLDNSDIMDPATMSQPTSGLVFQANPSLHVHTTFVVDTNFIISHLDILEDLRSLFEKYQHTIVIPRYTIKELDGLKTMRSDAKEKDVSKSNAVAKAARAANTWIYANLANTSSGVFGQRITQRISLDAVKDDAILDCCIYFKERLNCFVLLLSNDKNLCLKALTEEILTVSFRPGMTGDLIAERAFQENSYRFGTGMNHVLVPIPQHNQEMVQPHTNNMTIPHQMAFNDIALTIFEQIKNTTIQALNYVMLDEYGDAINCLDFHSDDINGFKDISKCIYDYWVSVFCEYFRDSKLKRDDWKGLPKELTSVPENPTIVVIFQQFWSEILEHLIIKRSAEEQQRLLATIEEWRMLATAATS